MCELQSCTLDEERMGWHSMTLSWRLEKDHLSWLTLILQDGSHCLVELSHTSRQRDHISWISIPKMNYQCEPLSATIKYKDWLQSFYWYDVIEQLYK